MFVSIKRKSGKVELDYTFRLTTVTLAALVVLASLAETDKNNRRNLIWPKSLLPGNKLVKPPPVPKDVAAEAVEQFKVSIVFFHPNR